MSPKLKRKTVGKSTKRKVTKAAKPARPARSAKSVKPKRVKQTKKQAKPTKRRTPAKPKHRKPMNAKKRTRVARVAKPKRSRAKPVSIPVTNMRRGTCEEVYKEYKSNQTLGIGQDAHAYALCDSKGLCPYVLRVEEGVELKHLQGRERMLKIAKLAADHGIGPKVLDAWYCERTSDGLVKFFMVSERLDGTLERFEWRGNSEASILQEEKEMYKDILGLVDRLHKLKIWHLDLTPSNVMYKNMPNGKRRWFLIDFLLSQFMDASKDHLPDDLSSADAETLEQKLVQSLRLLLTKTATFVAHRNDTKSKDRKNAEAFIKQTRTA